MSPQPTRDTLPRLSQLEALNDAIVQTQETLARIEDQLAPSGDHPVIEVALVHVRTLRQVWEEAR